MSRNTLNSRDYLTGYRDGLKDSGYRAGGGFIAPHGNSTQIIEEKPGPLSGTNAWIFLRDNFTEQERNLLKACLREYLERYRGLGWVAIEKKQIENMRREFSELLLSKDPNNEKWLYDETPDTKVFWREMIESIVYYNNTKFSMWWARSVKKSIVDFDHHTLFV